jgi:ribosomal protein L12E/L44/L45/RPP1/RPP2
MARMTVATTVTALVLADWWFPKKNSAGAKEAETKKTETKEEEKEEEEEAMYLVVCGTKAGC